MLTKISGALVLMMLGLGLGPTSAGASEAPGPEMPARVVVGEAIPPVYSPNGAPRQSKAKVVVKTKAKKKRKAKRTRR